MRDKWMMSSPEVSQSSVLSGRGVNLLKLKELQKTPITWQQGYLFDNLGYSLWLSRCCTISHLLVVWDFNVNYKLLDCSSLLQQLFLKFFLYCNWFCVDVVSSDSPPFPVHFFAMAPWGHILKKFSALWMMPLTYRRHPLASKGRFYIQAKCSWSCV